MNNDIYIKNVNQEDFEFVLKEDKVVHEQTYIRESFWSKFKRALFNNKPALICTIFLIIIITASILAPLSPFDPNEINPAKRLAPASSDNIFGTDSYGRDVLTRTLYGGRVSLLVGFATMICTVLIGTTIGVTSGYIGGKLDKLLMRATDIFLALPSMLLMIILNTFMKPGIITLVAVLSLFSWAQVARITRAETMSLKERDFIQASKNLGASNFGIAIKHIVPNVIGPITVAASLSIANAILTESSLSFLGLGVQVPQASWGSMLQEAQSNILSSPMLAVYPGMCIFITVLAFNLLGDVLSTTFDRK